MEKITVYGADWCSLTRHALQHLDEIGAQYKYINVEEDPDASEWVKKHNHGKEIKPTVDIGGRVLSKPTDRELDAALA